MFLLARGLLFVSCRWVRDMYAAVAAAVEGLQPGSKAAVAAHLDRTYWGTAQQTTAGQLTGGDAGTEAERGSEESEAEEAAELLAAAAEATPCTKGLGRSSSSSSDGSCSTGLAHTPSKVAEASAGNILRPTAHSTGSQACPAGPPAVKAAAHPLRRALDWAGLGPLQLKPALHMGLLIALAGSLVVVRPVYEALGSSTDWVIITGAPNWPPTWPPTPLPPPFPASALLQKQPLCRCCCCAAGCLVHGKLSQARWQAPQRAPSLLLGAAVGVLALPHLRGP